MAEPIITCIEDLRLLAKRRVPRMFYDYADFRRLDRKHLPRQRDRLPAHPSAPARCRGPHQPQPRHHHGGPAGGDARGAGARRYDRHAARRRRDPGGPRRGGGRHPLHALDHEHLLHRGRGREYGQAVLVPALRHARPRLHRPADRPRQGGRMLGAGADARFADPRPAPQGPQERALRAAAHDTRQRPRHRQQAALVDGHALNQAAHLPQHRRPQQEREGHARSGGVDRRAVRPDARAGTTSSASRTAGAAS